MYWILSVIWMLWLDGSGLSATPETMGPSDLADPADTLKIEKTADFPIKGNQEAQQWKKAEWIPLPLRSSNKQSAYAGTRETRVKILYSESGIYFLFECKDRRLTATMKSDFSKLWKEDVVEVFLWPDTAETAYLEYELSPLNFELPLLVSNEQGDKVRWRPFMYKGEQQTRHAVTVKGGSRKSGAQVEKWIAEIYIPFKLLRPLNNISPDPGTVWRANLYRVDYDLNKTQYWAWQAVKSSFHEYSNFGYFSFQ